MDWDKLRVFHAVASAGSLTHAGETLHLSQSAVSRQVTALEHSLGATLFHRHPRGLILTEQGELLFDATQEMSMRLSAAGTRIRDSKDEAYGVLRLTTTVGFGTLWVAPRLSKYLDTYSDLSIDLNLTEAMLDLPMREADAAIWMKKPQQADIIRRPIADFCIRLYASEEYLKNNPAPVTRSDLEDHRLIVYNTQKTEVGRDLSWLLDELSWRKRNLITVNNHYGVLQFARNGLGIAALPDYMARQEPNLKPVSPEIHGEPYTVYFAYPEELKKSQRIITFRDFIIDELSAFMR